MIKEIFGDVIKSGREAFVSVQNNFDAFFPGIMRVFAERQRRIAVPVLDFVNAEPFGF